ncbi:MAG: Coenzyme F420 hydrogenase/dehydrogenase, beta subunit C-terminal domain [Desulfobacteraceae bacterium]
MDKKNIDSVYKANLCHYCGICYGVCPKDNIEFEPDDTGNPVFRVKDDHRCGACELCYIVCPGRELNFTSLHRQVFYYDYTPGLLGSFIDCSLAHSKDSTLRRKAASGGVVSSLLISALEAGKIDGATVVKLGADDNPLKTTPFIARKKDEILSACGSKYLTVPMGVVLREIWQSSKEQHYAFVGLPCHVHGLRKAQQLIPRLERRVGPVISLFCGRGSSPVATEFVLKWLRLKMEEVDKIDYRYGKWPGGFAATLKTGQIVFLPLDDYVFIMKMFQNIRCAMCTDHTGEFADISIGDAWLKGLKGQEGWNAVIARTPLGRNILRATQQDERIRVFATHPSSIIESQKLMLYDKKIKIFASLKIARWLHLSHTIPQYTGLMPVYKPDCSVYLRALIFMVVPRLAAATSLRSLLILVFKLPLKLLKMDLKAKDKCVTKGIQKLSR